ncbi:von Willebrand factor A domain-containing protein 3A [Pygocentrus nattereri]|uniref:von Willebrand factor A domain-containing protein 3A n=1 Tax=Pygocentrus nattereri TaxID=42514 RepID=UPI001890B764|nr:von Willebrand factor A domain-containing protein 3A [Pygocentrus nattereri]XP_017556015.2 von Willebrand factor A domain-containing protein 3A [Pygocentrus nattereri]XP_017556016.2 von Willebrand factor A domain-containing protein 3A [Pygocentrus nattereri]
MTTESRTVLENSECMSPNCRSTTTMPCSKKPGHKGGGVSSEKAYKEGLFTSNSNETRSLKWRREQREGVDEWKSSVEWLEDCSLESCGLSLSHLFSHCSTAVTSLREDEVCTHLEIGSGLLDDFEMKLYQAIEMYHTRIQWLSQGSRKTFGVVKGIRLGVLIDSSDVNCSEERLENLQHNLLLLMEEQFSLKKQLHFLSFGTEVSSLWDRPRAVTPLSFQQAQEWVLQLRLSGDCNLQQALERAWSHTQLDSLLIILGSCPDQNPDNILTYVAQGMQNKELSVHVVAYDNCSPVAIETVKNIAKVTEGRYHLFSAALGVVDSSSDLEPLWAEIKAARYVLHHIQTMRHGEDMTVSVVSEISKDLDSLSLSDLKSETYDTSVALCIQPPAPLPTTSAEWLKTHSLKAKKLGLYQLLAPNVYSPLEGFVPILGKTVHSTVHEKAMVQFEWHDGTVKNVHVDPSLLQNYQKQLLEAERVLEDRVVWLSNTGSRQIWGIVCEQRVQVLLDMSEMNSHYQLHIQHAVRLLLQEQLPSTHSFNVTVFGSDVKPWREQMVPPTHENLQDVLQWIQGLECGGGRNTLAAIRRAVEDESNSDSSLTRGVYILTTGMPDQDPETTFAYVSECCSGSGVRLHVCLFAGENEPLRCLAPRYVTWAETAHVLRGLAHAGNGRFHWITDTGIVESDDIIVLIGEMEKAANYWQKCCELLDSLVQRCSCKDAEEAESQECCSPALYSQARPHRHKLPPPKPTLLSLARLGSKEWKQSHTWRPNSAKAVIPQAHPVHSWEAARPINSANKKKAKISHSVFYLENGSLGAVFKTYLKPKSMQKTISTFKLPKHEDICSTKQWLKQFGIRSLKLDLHKLVSGPECTHRKKLVRTVLKSVSAKYCTIFPSVQLNGCVRHLLLSPGELKQYLLQTERVLQRYAQRMQWLLSGSRRMFGCVLEQAVCVLLDMSGSMAPCLPKLQKELASLIWEQLHTNSVRFSMVAFSKEVRVWQAELVEASEERCKEAVQWLGQLSTHGSTSTLHALQAGCAFEDSLGVYLITDGRFDCSCSLVLKEAERLTAGKNIVVHTIALNCQDSIAGEFLKSLAHKTRGRFHEVPSHTDTAAAKELLSSNFSEVEDSALPVFEGDDLKRLREEIEKLKMFQKQAKAFREIILAKNPEAV